MKALMTENRMRNYSLVSEGQGHSLLISKLYFAGLGNLQKLISKMRVKHQLEACSSHNHAQQFVVFEPNVATISGDDWCGSIHIR